MQKTIEVVYEKDVLKPLKGGNTRRSEEENKDRAF